MSKRRWFFAPGIFVLALLLRLYRLEAQSLWLDEGSTWRMAGRGWIEQLLDLLNPFAAYPLYHLLLKLWVAIAGDGELALRLPSAVAGAAAVATIGLAAIELLLLDSGRWTVDDDDRSTSYCPPSSFVFPLAAALLALFSPYALWYAQEAKAYSLLMFAAALLVWSLARALRLATRRAWLTFAAVALVALFVHRIALLLLPGALLAWWAEGRDQRSGIRHQASGIRGWLFQGFLLVGGGGLIVAAMARGLGSDRAATGAYIPADPLSALGLTFVRFSLDRWPGDLPWWWLLPWAALAAWGLGAALRAAPARPSARLLLTMLIVPTLLFLAQLLFTRLYEARYLMPVFPLWCMLLAYPVAGPHPPAPIRFANRSGGVERIPMSHAPLFISGYGLLLAGALVTAGLALFQPVFGLFSGYPVKEQYREAMGELARRVHPDDLVVLHPSYLLPLYDYYMPRLSSDPAPTPVSFGDFKQGQAQFGQREWDTQRRERFSGYLRSFLLIAPEHARTVDVPKSGDKYGLVGLFFQYSREQRAWPCGIWGYVGVELFCQAAPEAYYTGAVPVPAIPMQARFGANLRLIGTTLKATVGAEPGRYRAGGGLPITFFWEVDQQLAEDYTIFIHLCRHCDLPPAAGADGPPLMGYLPTSTWLPGKPARDDRLVVLPRDLPPGRYTLLVGVYRPGDPSATARLPIQGGQTLERNRLVLGTVEIIAPETGAEGQQ